MIAKQINEHRCYELLRKTRWPQGITCPACAHSRVTIHAKFAGTFRRRYLCLNCRQTFSDLTGTPFARTNLPLRVWFRSLEFSESGESVKVSELARRLCVKWDTVVYIQRRLNAFALKADLLKHLQRALREHAND